MRGRYRSLVETFSEPRGPAEETAKAAMSTGYSMPDELPDADDEAVRRLDHDAMKRRLGREVCRVLELALGTATSEQIRREWRSGSAPKPPNERASRWLTPVSPS